MWATPALNGATLDLAPEAVVQSLGLVFLSLHEVVLMAYRNSDAFWGLELTFTLGFALIIAKA